MLIVIAEVTEFWCLKVKMTSKWPLTLQGQRDPIYLVLVNQSPKLQSVYLFSTSGPKSQISACLPSTSDPESQISVSLHVDLFSTNDAVSNLSLFTNLVLVAQSFKFQSVYLFSTSGPESQISVSLHI